MMKRLSLKTALAAFTLSMMGFALPAAAETVTFAWSPNPQTPQVDVALAKGYFKQAGLDVNIVSFPSGREGFEALIGNQVDFSFMAEFPAVTGALRGQKFGVVGDLARYEGSRIIGSAKFKELKSPADLAGLKIGTTLGTNVDYYLSQVLTTAGVKAEIINAAPSDLIPSLVRGDVEAAVTFPTFYEMGKKTLGDNYRELRVGAYQPHFIIAASQSTLDKKPATTQAFLGALAKAEADVKADPDAAMDAVLANLKGATNKDALKAMWADTQFRMTLDKNLLDLMVSQGNWIITKGVVKAEAPTSASMRPYLVDGPLKAIDPARVDLP
ncbi:ABC transporter substrate-binding protein [Affinirhizobium pseudoryzae]|jgi:NitT/TauT family transport system substrate-binding protein|uniref:ABC transporter substrate-binding protein n=1 Tax=Allorhizobium pseudoryzae TaxID=379684 RepID=UPI001F30A13F|nr:ABC transporter substrate-binding protein [Allorhizobium pseudoryzae]